jgi:beta-xylosidase
MKLSLPLPLRGLAVCACLVIATVAAAADGAFQYQNPVRAGDFPDPSVIRVGSDYWAAATSSEWAPHFPLLHSRDLVNWEVTGHVFATTPAWTKANFWAPEIAEDHGTFFIYYVARETASNHLAVAVATADQPGGPWTDHGPLVAQDAGSIDPVPFTDAEGVRWLVWKEDGNSRKQPTILWLQRLRADGLALVGERRELLRNDAPWEGAVVEGPFVLRRDGFYYLFYSGAACCGKNCNYALGVARAKTMTGPWEKAPANPILATNDAWRCPGHGSIVTDPDGRTWLLYHAYAQKGFVATGRELMLDEVVFGSDGWPTINRGTGPSVHAAGPRAATAQADTTLVRDDFDRDGELGVGWQWLIGSKPAAHVAGGALTLTAGAGLSSTVRSITVPTFVSETALDPKRIAAGASAGLVIYGDRANHIALLTDGRTAQVWSQQRGQAVKVAEAPVASAAPVRLRIACLDGNRFQFAIQDERGAWKEIGDNTDGSFLPPWDRGVRTGLGVSGPAGATASFDYFSATPGDENLFAK